MATPKKKVVKKKVVTDPKQSSTVPKQQDAFSMAQLAESWDVAASIMDQDPSLQKALNQILGIDAKGNKVSAPITDKNLQMQVLKSTDWYRKNTDDWRKFQTYKTSNPATFAADLQSNAEALVRNYAKAGLKIDAQSAIKLAEQMMMKSAVINGKVATYDTNYLQRTMAGSINFNQKRTINGKTFYDFTGGLETLSQNLYQKAWDYGFPASTSNAQFNSWFETNLKGLTAGTINPEDVDNELQKRAQSMFPGLSGQIANGQTLRQAADPWLTAIANEWEVDVNSLDLNDDYVQRAINYTDEKGGIAPMNLYDAKKLARRSPKWDYTQKAKEEKTGIASRILKDFGFLG